MSRGFIRTVGRSTEAINPPDSDTTRSAMPAMAALCVITAVVVRLGTTAMHDVVH